MRSLRILYMGTPEFAVAPLKRLLQEHHHIVGAVTAPDRLAGRGRKPKASAVKKFALSENIEVLQPTNLKSEAFQADLKRLQVNLIIVVAFRMLPEKVWAFPEFGTFNLHASLLPYYRGAAPINWAIINGEKETGVTTFMIDKKIDTGNILSQKKLKIHEDETAGDLHDRLMEAGSSLVEHTVKGIAENTLKATPQNSPENLKTAPKLNNKNTEINWGRPGREIVNHILGLSPYPAAWSTLENGEHKLRCKIYRAKFEKASKTGNNGELVNQKNQLKVSVQDGWIDIKELQVQGKRRMLIKDFLNGFNLDQNSKFI